MLAINNYLCLNNFMKKTALIIFILLWHSYAPSMNPYTSNDGLLTDMYEYYWQGILERETNNKHTRGEGKYKKVVISHKDAIGVAQVLQPTFNMWVRATKAKEIHKYSIYVEPINRLAGRWYFSNAFFNVHKHDYRMAISSYNMGWNSKKTNVKYYKAVIVFAKTATNKKLIPIWTK